MAVELDKGVPGEFGAVCYRKQRRKRQKLLLIELFFDFAKNTTLHGLRYITERGLTAVEKTFWLVTFVISVSLCFFLIRNVWIKWKTCPVIVTFNEQLVPVGQVPFPSVTICPQMKSKKSKYDYSNEWARYLNEIKPQISNRTASEEQIYLAEKLDDIGIICKASKATTSRKFANASVVKHIVEVSPTSSDIFHWCVWHSEFIDCDKVFKRVLTSEGVCYNFNALAANEIFRKGKIQDDYIYLNSTRPSRGWTSDGYVSDNSSTYPRRGRENGASPDMEITLQELKSDHDDMCNSLSSGYKIFLQHPGDYPHDSLYYYAALPDQVSSLALKFSMLSTSDSLKDYVPEVRQCYFPTERPLRYFRSYSANHCILECQSNYTFSQCGCVWFDMPHYDSDHICTYRKRQCVKNAKDKLAVRGFNSGKCRCLPVCDSIQYDAEILKTNFNLKSYMKTFKKQLELKWTPQYHKYAYSKIELYFKESRFVSTRRSELYGLTDFLANCGGLLGLFLGFSFLSLVEIIYFLTLRLGYTLRRDLRDEKAARRKSNE